MMGHHLRASFSVCRRTWRRATGWVAVVAVLLCRGSIRGDTTANPAPLDPTSAVTFNRDVAPLIYAHCSTCHREGEAAPFTLINFDDARRHAKRIVEVTAQRIMPPWKAEVACAPFIGERRLADGQVALLRRWVEQGCPEGAAADAPAAPSFADGWQLGPPDMIVKMDAPFDVPAGGRDIYRCFAIPLQIPAGKYLRAVEYHPGNRRVVHHAVLTTLASDLVAKKLAAEPEGSGPGFRTGLPAPGERLPGPLGIWAPGKDPLPLPDGYAMRWPARSDLLLQLHLHPSGKPEREQSSVGLYFTSEKPRGALRAVVLMNKQVDIVAGDAHYNLTQSLTLPVAADVIGLFPHMHLIGRTVKTTATLPDGTTQSLLTVNDWDFNWQTYYQYTHPVRLPAGTKIDAEWTFDNSAANPTNPSNPPRRVRFGEQTTDEMGVVILDVIPLGRGGR